MGEPDSSASPSRASESSLPDRQAGRWLREGRLDREALIPALEEFLRELLRAAQLDLQAQVKARAGEAADAEVENVEVAVSLDGPDAELLLERKGELLLALEHLALRWLRLDSRHHDRLRFDCRDYRAGRVAELKLAAETAAARVRQSRAPFRFQPMNARERRIVHLALKDSAGVRTTSEGEGELRAVVIYPVPETAQPRS